MYYMFIYSGADLEGAHPAHAPLFALICKTKKTKTKSAPPVQSDNFYCLRPPVQHFLDPCLYIHKTLTHLVLKFNQVKSVKSSFIPQYKVSKETFACFKWENEKKCRPKRMTLGKIVTYIRQLNTVIFAFYLSVFLLLFLFFS